MKMNEFRCQQPHQLTKATEKEKKNVYNMMTKCWDINPTERPQFCNLEEDLHHFHLTGNLIGYGNWNVHTLRWKNTITVLSFCLLPNKNYSLAILWYLIDWNWDIGFHVVLSILFFLNKHKLNKNWLTHSKFRFISTQQ